MTTQLSEDVVLIAAPHLVTTDVSGGAAAGGGVSHRGPFSGSVELGRRLLLAARHGQTAQVLDLMAKGAPFTTDWLGTSPLHVAAYGAHVETCGVLLRAGVSRDSRTKVDRTPLHLAAHAGHAAVCALLLERGALVDCRDMLRMTPLHWAAERGHAAAARVLVRHGADPRAASKFHKTPLQLAAARGHLAILRLMEDALKEREAADSVDALKHAHEQTTEIPAAEQQQALESIERIEESAKPSKPAMRAQIKIELETETQPEVQESPAENTEDGSGGNADGGAAALLRKHGITLLPHDSSSTVLNAIQSGRTVVLSDAGKLMLKESSSAPAAGTTPPSKGVILTAAPVKATPAGVKIFTLNNKLRATDKLPIKKLVNPQDMQIKLVSLADTKLTSTTRVSNVAMKAKARRGGGAGAAGGRPPVKIIMQKANFDKMLVKNVDNGMGTSPIQITSTTDLGKVFQMTNATSTIAPTATVIGSTGGIIGNTGSVVGNMGSIVGNMGSAVGNMGSVVGNMGSVVGNMGSVVGNIGSVVGNMGSVVGNTGSVVGNTGSVPGTGFMCVPAEFLSSNSPAYLRSQLLAAHKTIHELNQQVTALKEQLAAYETME